MAKYIGPVCKLCRREGEKLFLKGERCFSPKCAFEKRGFTPGQHGRTSQGRSERESDYARQLRAKQKARRVYGILERQFRRYFSVAQHRRGLTGLTCCRPWNCGWTTWFSAWVWPRTAPRHASWSTMVISW